MEVLLLATPSSAAMRVKLQQVVKAEPVLTGQRLTEMWGTAPLAEPFSHRREKGQ